MAKDKTGGNPPNIKLKDGAEAATADGVINAPGGNPIVLPSLTSQRAGFYHAEAARIIRLYPDRYIPYVDKGGNS